MRVQLICENVGFDDIEFELSDESLVLGRSLRADVQVVHPLISRLHCEWKLIEGEVVVRDLESTNHTLINGEPARQAVLRSGDRILLGDVLYIVELEEISREISASGSAESSSLDSDAETPSTRLVMKSLSSHGTDG